MAVQKIQTIDVITINAANVAQPISGSKMVTELLLVADGANTGDCYVGSSNVTSSNGIVFGPAVTVEIAGPASPKGQDEFDLADVYVCSATAGNKIRAIVFVRK